MNENNERNNISSIKSIEQCHDGTDLNKIYEESLKKVKKDIHDKISKRQLYNYKCLEVLIEYVKKYPDCRFMQILSNVGLDEIQFYEESVDTYERIK